MFHKKSFLQIIFFLTPLFGVTLLLYSYFLGGSTISFPWNETESVSSQKIAPSEQSFRQYLDQLFQEEVTASTLNLHYTLSDPKSEQITDYPVTLGHFSAENEAQKLLNYENMKATLLTWEDVAMSDELRLTYDILLDTVEQNLALASYTYYEEPLKSTGGVQAEFPILLAEYAFYSEQDVKDYLSLLESYDDYFEELCEFERGKAKRGLFMNETAVNNLIAQCRAFLPEDSVNSFWETTFQERLNKIASLSEKQKKAYIQQNHALLLEHVYPAYHHLIAVLKSLQHQGKNDQGLCYLEDGKKYYELLVKATTGSDRSIEELKKIVSNRRAVCLQSLSSYSAANRISDRQEYTEKSIIFNNKKPEDYLDYLQTQILNDFPELPDTTYTVKEVNKKLEDFLSPAFYLTSPMDNYTDNCIYINYGNNFNDIELFTTLAHEGYPGHLFQTVYAYEQQLPPLRYLLYHGGYTEGWATYVEMLSYHYAGLNEYLAQTLQLNQDAILSLYATMDLCIHYDGWSLADTIDFLSDYGITDVSTASRIYQAIVENPANYLKYYIGYLEFLNLKAQAENLYGTDFSNKYFHTAVLNMGSAPFYIMKDYLPAYYEAARKQ